MTNEELKNKYKNLSPETLESYGIISPAKNGGYICPFCGNGSGEDGTGVNFSLLNEGYEGYCFKCGEHFDVFKIVAANNHLNCEIDFPAVLDKARNIFGDDIKVNPVKIKSVDSNEKPKTDYTQKIEFAKTHLKYFLKNYGDGISYRGLCYELLEKFFCGFYPRLDGYTDRFIIPSSYNHFLARLVVPYDELPNYQKNKIPDKGKRHYGKKEIFALNLSVKEEKAIFAVEGEFDAMSIWQCGFPAIAFGGSEISKNIMIPQLKKIPAQKFILMLDNDDAGKLNTPKLLKILRDTGHKAISVILSEKYKDANEFLQADSDGLTARLAEISSTADFDAQDTESTSKVREITEKDIEELKKKQDSDRKKEESRKARQPTFTQELVPDCPINLKLDSVYIFSKKDIRSYARLGKEEVEVVFTRTPIVITKTIQTTQNTEGQVEIAYYKKSKRKWLTHVLPRSDLYDTRKLLQLADLGISIVNSKVKFLAEYFDSILFEGNNPLVIPEITVHKQTGWTDKTFTKFIYPPGDGENFIVQNSGFDYAAAFTEKGDPAEWINFFKKIYSLSAVFRYTLGTALAAPLVAVCHVRNIQTALSSTSGNGKSAAAKFAMSIYGDPEKMMKTFNSTDKFIDSIGAKFNDLPCWVDEFQSSDPYIKKKIQDLVYNYANGITRGRLNRNAEERPQQIFSGARITTGEQNPLPDWAGQGAMARLIVLNVTKVFPDDISFDIHQNFIPNNYGHFGRKWIDFIIANKENIQKTFANLLRTYMGKDENGNKISNSTEDFLPAHMQAIALNHTAQLYFCKMLELDESLDVKEFLCDDFKLMTEKVLPSRNETKNITRALSVVSQIIQSHEKYFKVENPARTGEAPFAYYKEEAYTAYGIKYNNGDVGFFPNALKKIITDAGFPSADAIIKGFAEAGFLQCGNDKNHLYQFRKTKWETRTWLYYFPAKAFDDEAN